MEISSDNCNTQALDGLNGDAQVRLGRVAWVWSAKSYHPATGPVKKRQTSLLPQQNFWISTDQSLSSREAQVHPEHLGKAKSEKQHSRERQQEDGSQLAARA